jgi:hypothetical protein
MQTHVREWNLHGEHRTESLSDDLFGHAAHQQPTQPGAAMRAHRNEVALCLPSYPEDFHGGVAVLDPVLDPGRGVGRVDRA